MRKLFELVILLSLLVTSVACKGDEFTFETVLLTKQELDGRLFLTVEGLSRSISAPLDAASDLKVGRVYRVHALEWNHWGGLKLLSYQELP